MVSRFFKTVLPAGACVLALSAMASPAFAAEKQAEQSALFILDGSGSMWGRLPDGQAKITAAKATLGSLLRDIPHNISVGLMAYGHRRKGDCADIQLMQPYANGGAQSADLLAKRIIPHGKTPISDSLVEAGKVTAGRSGQKTIVLVSDGLETCKGDPCAVAESLSKADANLKIHVVGFDVDRKTTRQLSCIAEKGKGAYFAADDTDGLKKAISAVTKAVIKAEAVEVPKVVKAEAPKVETASKGKRIKILGPGTLQLKLAPWAKMPKYWKVLEPETGEEIVQTSSASIKLKPGQYQIAWRQVEHGAKEVALPLVVTVKPGKVTQIPVDTGMRLIAPESMKKRPYYYMLLNDEAELKKYYSKRSPVAYYSIWGAVPVPPGQYSLIFRQSKHGHSEVNLGKIDIKPGQLVDHVMDQGINLQWPKEWNERDANSIHYLKVTDEKGHVMKFRYRGPIILAPGKYKIAFRVRQHGWSESHWGEVTVPEKGFVDLKLNSGIKFLSKEKGRHVIYATNLETKEEVSIANHWGPMLLAPGRYRLDFKQRYGKRFTIMEEVEIPANTLVEAEM